MSPPPGRQAQPASDLYSLGVTLHQLLTGLDPSEPPYELPPIRTLRPELPRELRSSPPSPRGLPRRAQRP